MRYSLLLMALQCWVFAGDDGKPVKACFERDQLCFYSRSGDTIRKQCL